MQPRLALVEEQTAGLCEKKKTTEVELQKLTAQEDKIGGEVSSSRLERVMTMSLAGTRARGARAAAERRGRAAPQVGGDQGLTRRRRAERRSEDEVSHPFTLGGPGSECSEEVRSPGGPRKEVRPSDYVRRSDLREDDEIRALQGPTSGRTVPSSGRSVRSDLSTDVDIRPPDRQ